MAAEYKQLLDPMTGSLSSTVLRMQDEAYIPNDPANRDYQDFLTWLAAGNIPDPPDG